MAQQNINTGTLPNDKTGDSLRNAMIKVQNNFTELYTTAPISNSVNIGNTTSNVLANSTTVFIGNSGTYSIANSSSIITTIGYHSQVLNSGSNNLVIGTTNATSVLVYTNGITSANLRIMVAANGNVGVGNGAPNELLTVGGTLSANQLIIGNTTVNFTINATFIPATANYALSANNTNYVGSVSAANVVSNAQLSANVSTIYSNVASIYQTMSGLSANVATLTSNNTSFVGSVSAANVVSNAQLSANLSNYQTTAGLSANVAKLTANNTSFVGSVSAANVVSNAQLSANLSNYQTTAGLSANVVKLTANNTTYVNGKTEDNLNVNSASYAASLLGGGGISVSSITASANVSTNGSLTLATVPFFRNIPTVNSNYTVSNTYNEMSIGPITINDGVTVTVNDSATWQVL